MASIQKRPSGQWRARYRDREGKEHARHFDRKADAQRWLDHVSCLESAAWLGRGREKARSTAFLARSSDDGNRWAYVDAEGEAGFGGAEVLGDGLDGLTRVDEHRGAEVPKGVHAVVPAGLDAGIEQGVMPDTVNVRSWNREASPRLLSWRTRGGSVEQAIERVGVEAMRPRRVSCRRPGPGLVDART